MRSASHFATSPLRHSMGQSTVETALLLGAVAVALVVMFSFIRASVASRVKSGADAFGQGLQYEGQLGQSQ